MKKITLYLLVATLAITVRAQSPLTLWYRQPATLFTEALPIGNGDLGAMIYGGIGEDHLQLNESTFWTGQPHSYQREDANQYLDTSPPTVPLDSKLSPDEQKILKEATTQKSSKEGSVKITVTDASDKKPEPKKKEGFFKRLFGGKKDD